MGNTIVILGASGNAYDVLDIVDGLNAAGEWWEVAGFLDDSKPYGSKYLDLPVLGGLADARRFDDCLFISSIHNDRAHKRAPEILAKTGLAPERYATLVHPKSCVSPRARLGRGVYVNFGASVAGGVAIGDHSSVGPGCIIGHGSEIGDHAILAPGSILSGGIRVGACTYIGTGAVVRENVQIGAGCLVGMGAIVLRDVEPDSTVVGNPAHPLLRASLVRA